MNPNQHPHNPESYRLPDNQMQAELDFIQKFEQHHPDMTHNLRALLGGLRSVTGGTTYAFKATEHPPQDLVRLEDGPDDEKHLHLRSSISVVRLSSGIDKEAIWSDPKYADMSERERSTLSLMADKHAIIGEVPPSMKDMLKDFYALIGAETVRDDERDEGATEEGIVLRRGTYYGETVFVQELRTKFPDIIDIPIFSMTVHDQESGEILAEALSPGDYKRVQEAGLDRSRVRQMELEGTLRHSNVSDVIDIINQLK